MSKRRVFWLLIVAALLFFIDWGSKYLVETYLSSSYGAPLYPYGGIGVFQNFLGVDFSINRVSNQGGAWGIFSSYPIALVSLRIGIILFLALYTFFFNRERKRDIPLVLILVGATGNIVDFFTYGAVVDMFHFMLGRYSFPVFNVADSLIFLGVATLFIQSLFEKRFFHAHQPSKN